MTEEEAADEAAEREAENFHGKWLASDNGEQWYAVEHFKSREDAVLYAAEFLDSEPGESYFIGKGYEDALGLVVDLVEKHTAAYRKLKRYYIFPNN